MDHFHEHDGSFCGGGDTNDMHFDRARMENQINGGSTAAVALTEKQVALRTAPAGKTANKAADATAPITVPPMPPSIKPSSCQHAAQYCGCGGMPSPNYETEPTNRDPVGSNDDIQNTLDWSRVRCVPRMVNVFVYMKNECLKRDKKVSKYQLYAKDTNWFWRLVAENVNKKSLPELNHNLFSDDHSFPGSLRELDPYYPEAYAVNEIKLKTDFCKLRASFVRVYAKFQKPGMGDGSNDDEGENCEHKIKVKSRKFVCFCRGDMCLLYLFACCNKYDILNSTLVPIPTRTRHSGGNISNPSTPKSKRRQYEGLDRIGNELENPIQIATSAHEIAMRKVKREKIESETFSRLPVAYMETYNEMNGTSIPPFLQSINKARLKQIEMQLETLMKPVESPGPSECAIMSQPTSQPSTPRTSAQPHTL